MRSATAIIESDAVLPHVRVEDLRVVLRSGHDVVSDISFDVGQGEILGLVGESGSGKTTIACALLGYARPGARIVSGRVSIDGVELLRQRPQELQRARGKLVSYVPQDPATALSPLRRIGAQLLEVLEVHEPALSRGARQEKVLSALANVELSTKEGILDRFPHELSGGQLQRVVLALAFILRPRLVVLDEPTTALDVTIQAKILGTIRRLCRTSNSAAVFVSHDLAVAKSLVNRVIVLYAGRVAESATRAALFASPAHPYTRALLSAAPDVTRSHAPEAIPGRPPVPGRRSLGCSFADRCSRARSECSSNVPELSEIESSHVVACFHPVFFGAASSGASAERRAAARPAETLLSVRALDAAYGSRQVLFDVAFDLRRGECLALVGESGSGKTTLARTLAGLNSSARGQVLYEGSALALRGAARTGRVPRVIQYVFQNPHRALNPRKTVGRILGAAIRHSHPYATDPERRTLDALEQVALSAHVIDRYPRALSGGERQRVAIARSLVCEPSLLICDEVTSSLDVSVQATILELLRVLQERGLSILFVTHNLGVVRAVADRVLVLNKGRIVESGTVDDVLTRPHDAYTRALVRDSPSLYDSAGLRPIGSPFGPSQARDGHLFS